MTFCFSIYTFIVYKIYTAKFIAFYFSIWCVFMEEGTRCVPNAKEFKFVSITSKNQDAKNVEGPLFVHMGDERHYARSVVEVPCVHMAGEKNGAWHARMVGKQKLAIHQSRPSQAVASPRARPKH